jgi:hypothetical protein
MEDNNIRVVSQRLFVDEPISICLVVCFPDMTKVHEILLKRMGKNIKNIMEVRQIKLSLKITEKKKTTVRVKGDMYSCHISEVSILLSKISFEV